MKKTILKPNFIYPDNITPETYVFGAGSPIDDPILREDGDWRKDNPQTEDQNRNGVESSACFTEAQQHDIASLMKELWNLNVNFASRFNALLSGGTPYGGNPISAAESIRKDGLIPEEMLPFDESIALWDDFHSWKGGNERACRAAGQAWLKKWEPRYHVVFQKNDPIEVKYARLREALKRGPVSISMYAWVEEGGVYIKPAGVNDSHLIEATYLDPSDRLYIFDTYPPYEKIIAAGTNFDFAIQWSIRKRPEVEKASSFWEMIIQLIKKIWA